MVLLAAEGEATAIVLGDDLEKAAVMDPASVMFQSGKEAMAACSPIEER